MVHHNVSLSVEWKWRHCRQQIFYLITHAKNLVYMRKTGNIYCFNLFQSDIIPITVHVVIRAGHACQRSVCMCFLLNTCNEKSKRPNASLMWVCSWKVQHLMLHSIKNCLVRYKLSISLTAMCPSKSIRKSDFDSSCCWDHGCKMWNAN